jgi:hypothetical protein
MLSRRLPAAAKVKSNGKIDAYRPEEEELEEPFDSIWPSFEADYPYIGLMFLEHQRGSVENEKIFSNMTGIDMYQFMRSNLFFDATNLVDKVYGLLGIVGDGTVLDDLQPQLTNEVAEPSLQINYRKIVLQVYQDFTIYIINRGGD